jgi:drug/metabolite transporter (DMT)-like permease
MPAVQFFAIVACLLWGTGFVPVKIGLRYADPLIFAGMRFIIAGLVLLPFCGRIKDVFLNLRNNFSKIIVLSFFQTFGLYSLFFIGMKFIPSAKGAVIIGASPVFAAITAHLMINNDKLNFVKSISIIIGLAGILSIGFDSQFWHMENMGELFGVILLVLGSVFSAVGNVIVSKNRGVIKPVLLNSLQFISGGVLLTMSSLAFEGIPHMNYPAAFYLSLVWLSVMSAIAFSIWFILLQKSEVKVSELNVWKFLIPVVGVVLSWVMLPDEEPAVNVVVGMVFVVLSIILIHSKLLINERIKIVSESE